MQLVQEGEICFLAYTHFQTGFNALSRLPPIPLCIWQCAPKVTASPALLRTSPPSRRRRTGGICRRRRGVSDNMRNVKSLARLGYQGKAEGGNVSWIRYYLPTIIYCSSIVRQRMLRAPNGRERRSYCLASQQIPHIKACIPNSSRATMSFWICVVPSGIVITRAPRKSRSTGYSGERP